MTKRFLNLLLAACFVTLVGCAEEGINESALTVDAENKNEVASFASLGAERSISDSAAPGRALVSRSIDSMGTVQRLLSRNSTTVDLSSDVCPDGGSAIYEIDASQSGNSGTVTIVYSNCADSFGDFTSVTNGTADFTFAEDGATTIRYDITTTYDGETFTISGTYACDANFNCTYETEFSADGVDYRISNVSTSYSVGDDSWDVSARIYHEELGYVEITGSDLVECENGGFSSGTISVTDDTNSTVMTITYVSCTEMTVTFNNVSETVAQ